jgi:NAD(P)-dependent dehydrogenase (short-subunit alcohol dehydrogenase family)
MSGEVVAELDGRHLVVTVAGTGIGLAIARRVSRDGASLTLLGRDEDRLRAAASSPVGPTRVAPCDIRQRKAVDGAFGLAVSALGPIQALVAPAGIGGPNADGAGDRFDDLVEPDDVAGVVAWLLSADARGVTGQAIDQNGGAWMG